MTSIFGSIDFWHIAADELSTAELVPSAPQALAAFDFDDKTLARAFAHGAR